METSERFFLGESASTHEMEFQTTLTNLMIDTQQLKNDEPGIVYLASTHEFQKLDVHHLGSGQNVNNVLLNLIENEKEIYFIVNACETRHCKKLENCLKQFYHQFKLQNNFYFLDKFNRDLFLLVCQHFNNEWQEESEIIIDLHCHETIDE